MFKSSWRIAELFGIPIYLESTFALLLVFFVIDLPLELALICVAVLAVSIVLHELGHSLTARQFGYPTTGITLSLLGGCASLIALPRKAWQEFLTAIAGPLVSFALSLGGYLALVFLPLPRLLAEVAYVLMVINLALGSFNLLPALPMDGGRIFRSALRLVVSRVRATFVAMWVGRACAVALVVLPMLGIRHLGPIPIGGKLFFRVLIAWMIWNEGAREYRLALAEGDFGSWDQSDFDARVSPPPYAR